MKKLFLSTGLTVALATAPAMARDLIYSTIVTPTHPVVSEVMEPLAEHMRQATNGEIDIKVNAGGALAGGKETLGALESGLIDLGQVIDLYSPGELPNSVNVSSINSGNNDPRVLTGAANETQLITCESCKGDYHEKGLQQLLYYAVTPLRLVCKDKVVTSLNDWKGLRVRATGGMGQLTAAFGGVPANLPITDTYEAMQRGTIDCTIASLPWLDSYGFKDVTSDVTSLALGTLHQGLPLVARMEVVKSLSPQARQALIEELPNRAVAAVKRYLADDAAIDSIIKDANITVHDADDSMVKALAEYIDGEIDRTSDVSAGRGAKQPREDLQGFMANVDKWQKIVDDIGGGEWNDAQWSEYADRLKTEIYDKLAL